MLAAHAVCTMSTTKHIQGGIANAAQRLDCLEPQKRGKNGHLVVWLLLKLQELLLLRVLLVVLW